MELNSQKSTINKSLKPSIAESLNWLPVVDQKLHGVETFLNPALTNISWKETYIKNSINRKELKKLGVEFKKINAHPLLLKGWSLLDHLYENDGLRNSSDVDLLISPTELPAVCKILEENHFKLQKESLWKGNAHKKVYVKWLESHSVVIELHTKLFWQTKDFDPRFKESSIRGFLRLSLEDEFCFLVYHYGFQHTFSNIKWLIDIGLHLQKYRDDYDLKRLKEVFIKTGCQSALIGTEHLLLTQLKIKPTKLFEPRLSDQILKLLLNRPFMVEPKSNPLKYQIIKNLVKGSIKYMIIYNFGWIWMRIKKGLHIEQTT